MPPGGSGPLSGPPCSRTSGRALHGEIGWVIASVESAAVLDALMAEVARHLDLPEARLRRPSRRTLAADARAIVMELAA